MSNHTGVRLLTMREVAERLAHGYDWFRRQRKTLERDEGFPKPVSGCGNRWDPRAIDRWLAAQGGPAVTVNVDIADVANKLDGRARQIGERLQ